MGFIKANPRFQDSNTIEYGASSHFSELEV